MKRFAAALMALVLLMACHTALAGSDAYVSDFRADIVVRADGALEVQELLTYQVEDHINGFTRDIDPTIGTGVTGFGAALSTAQGDLEFVYDGGALKGDAGVYYAENLDNGLIRYYIFLPCDEGDSATIAYSYTLEGVCARYRDVGVLDAPLLGDAWELEIDRYTLNMTFEKPVAGDIDLRVNSPGMDIEDCETLDERVRITGTDAGEGDALRVRVMFPSSALSGMAYTSDGNMRDELLAREAQYDAQVERNYRLGLGLGIGLAALAVALGVLGYVLWGRDPRVAAQGYAAGSPLPTEPGVSPAELGTVLSRNHVDVNGLAATLLDLTRRGYLTLECGEDEMAYVRTVKPMDDCAPHEQYALNWILGLGDGQRVTLDEIESHADESSYSTHFTKWAQMVNKGAKQRGWYVKSPWTQIVLGLITLITSAAVLAMGAYLLGMEDVYVDLALGLLMGALALLTAGIVVIIYHKRTEKGAQLAADWREVKRWLKGDWSAADVPADTALWEEMMVYALVLGVEKQLAQRLDSMDAGYAEVMSRSRDAVLMRSWGEDAALYGMYCAHAHHCMSSRSSSSSSGGVGSGAGGGGGGGTF